jgi:hypothetical protein
MEKTSLPYPPEFKEEAVRLVSAGRGAFSVEELASDGEGLPLPLRSPIKRIELLRSTTLRFRVLLGSNGADKLEVVK